MQRVAEKPQFGAKRETKFDQILESELLKADPSTPTIKLAERIYDSQRYDMETLFRAWVVLRITRLLRAKAPDAEPLTSAPVVYRWSADIEGKVLLFTDGTAPVDPVQLIEDAVCKKFLRMRSEGR